MTMIPFYLPPSRTHSRTIRMDCDCLLISKKIRVTTPYNKQLIDIFRQMEGARWKKPSWEFLDPTHSDRNAFILGEYTRGAIGYPQDSPMCMTSYYKRAQTYYETVDQFMAGTKDEDWPYPLKDHQKELVYHFLTVRSTIAAHEMGLGKTLSFLTALKMLYDQNRLQGEVWVIAPKAPLLAWKAELKKWKFPTDLIPIKFITCSVQSISKVAESAATPPQVLCVDESSRLKTPAAQRTVVVREITHHMRHDWQKDSYIILMTGTPAPKDPTDWWSQQEICRPGLLRENSKKNLLKSLADLEQKEGNYGGSYTQITNWRSKDINKLYQRMKPNAHIRLKKDCLDLPQKTYTRLRVPPSKEVISAAKIVADNSGTAIEALSKIRQLSDGFQYREQGPYTEDIISDEVLDKYFQTLHGDKRTKTFNTPKDKILTEILEDFLINEKNRIVIYTGFKASAHKIKDLCHEAGWSVIFSVGGSTWKLEPSVSIADSETVLLATQEQFQTNNLDTPIAFVATVGSAGMGITLHASDTIVYYSNDFNAENRIQSEDRIHRIGMGASANIIDIIHLPTDEYVLDLLQKKRRLQELSMGDVMTALDQLTMEDLV